MRPGGASNFKVMTSYPAIALTDMEQSLEQAKLLNSVVIQKAWSVHAGWTISPIANVWQSALLDVALHHVEVISNESWSCLPGTTMWLNMYPVAPLSHLLYCNYCRTIMTLIKENIVNFAAPRWSRRLHRAWSQMGSHVLSQSGSTGGTSMHASLNLRFQRISHSILICYACLGASWSHIAVCW